MITPDLTKCPICGGKIVTTEAPPNRRGWPQCQVGTCPYQCNPRMHGALCTIKAITDQGEAEHFALTNTVITIECARLQAIAERDFLAEKLVDISEKMNRVCNAETVFCRACDICPVGEAEMEGRTCLVAVLEAAQKAGEQARDT